jgi:aryl carrier-like protein
MKNNITIKNTIVQCMHDIAKETGGSLVSNIHDETVLLESGLDSIGFAILVARLEEDLGYDPFILMQEPVYPRTLGELVAIYQRFAP